MHLLYKVKNALILGRDVKPGTEPGEVLFLIALRQRIFGEQIANLHNRRVYILRSGVLADEEQVRVAQDEDPVIIVLDHSL